MAVLVGLHIVQVAICAGCAEAKTSAPMLALLTDVAICAGCAEAKFSVQWHDRSLSGGLFV